MTLFFVVSGFVTSSKALRVDSFRAYLYWYGCRTYRLYTLFVFSMLWMMKVGHCKAHFLCLTTVQHWCGMNCFAPDPFWTSSVLFAVWLFHPPLDIILRAAGCEVLVCGIIWVLLLCRTALIYAVAPTTWWWPTYISAFTWYGDFAMGVAAARRG